MPSVDTLAMGGMLQKPGAALPTSVGASRIESRVSLTRHPMKRSFVFSGLLVAFVTAGYVPTNAMPG
jgi:hypothetical protein